MTTRTIHRPFGVLLICSALLMQLCAAPASAKKRKLPRPSATVVKQVITENWDTDRTGPNYTELTFHKITISKTRRRHVYERAPSYYVTPVRVVFTQTTTYGPGPGQRDVARITQNALFYKGEFDWTYHSKGAKVVYIERM
jgi:hypothetical protein